MTEMWSSNFIFNIHAVLALALGGAVASWLVRSSPERVVWVNCWGNLTNCGGMTCDGLASCPGGVDILLAAIETRDKLQQLWSTRIEGFIFMRVLYYLRYNEFLPD